MYVSVSVCAAAPVLTNQSNCPCCDTMETARFEGQNSNAKPQVRKGSHHLDVVVQLHIQACRVPRSPQSAVIGLASSKHDAWQWTALWSKQK